MSTGHNNSKAANARFGSASRAFTLIEVVLGITILAMITGTLFALIRGSVQAASGIERIQRENDSVNRLIELCRQTFQTLPSTGTVTLSAVGDGLSAMQELTISGSPKCFGFGINSVSYKDTILGLRPDPDTPTSPETELPRYYLSISREDLIPTTDDSQMALRQDTTGLAAPDDQGRYWMPLLPAVNTLTWRFYKQTEDLWSEEWSDSNLPDLIEMNLTMEGRNLPMRVVFAVPVLSLREGTQRGGATTPTENNTGATTGTVGAPTGGGRGGDGGPPRDGGRGMGPPGGGRGFGPPGGGGPGFGPPPGGGRGFGPPGGGGFGPPGGGRGSGPAPGGGAPQGGGGGVSPTGGGGSR